MTDDNILKKCDKFQQNTIDDLIYGKDEDIFERNVRRKESEAKYGNRHVAAWTPFLFAYVNIKQTVKNPEYTTLEKIGGCAVAVTCELILDAVRVGSIYGFYKLTTYLDIIPFK